MSKAFAGHVFKLHLGMAATQLLLQAPDAHLQLTHTYYAPILRTAHHHAQSDRQRH